MGKYAISANGSDMGIYDGANSEEAIAAYIKNAGYETVAEAADVCGQSEDEFLADLVVMEED